jgi:ADP-heptose:LPS heptosyltransferase
MRQKEPPSKIDKILVFRLGSIGDFVVSLPCFHLIREKYPHAKIALLTNEPVSGRAAPAVSVLEGTNLVDQYLSFPPGTRNPRELSQLKKTIQSAAPTTLIYLAERRGISVYRDYLFFRWCGIRRIIGLPATRDLQHPRSPARPNGLWEPEAQRLGRLLASLGDIDFELPQNWDLHLTSGEIKESAGILGTSGVRFLGLSVGTKLRKNDWGTSNWRAVLKGLENLNYGIVFIGSMEDREQSQRLADGWPRPTLNLCGRTSPRLSAAVIRQTALFLCHDSGPMHLAAAVGTRCVAVFSRQNPPGQWYPFGSDHRIFYPPLKTDTIQSIRPHQVIAAVQELLGTN